MKALIWILAILLNSLITSALNMKMGSIGGLLAGLLWVITIYPAYKLCEKWDVYKLMQEAEEKKCKPIDILLKNNSEKEKASLERCRGDEGKIIEQLKTMNTKKQYRKFYIEHFMTQNNDTTKNQETEHVTST